MHRFASGLVLAGAFAAIGCGSAPVAPAAALATEQRGVTSIAVDDFFVYWAIADGSVKRVSLDGGPVTTLVAAHVLVQPDHIQVDATHVYWSTHDGTIGAAPKAGGPVVTLATNEEHLTDLAVYATSHPSPEVYWTASLDGLVKRATLTTPAVTLASKRPAPGPIAARAEGVFWAEVPPTNGDLVAMPIGGGDVAPLVTGLSEPTTLSVNATHIVWGSTGDAKISRAAIDGSDTRVIAKGLGALGALAADDSDVYWTTAAGDVMKASGSGGVEPVLIATGAAAHVSLALDATSLYWANAFDGAIMAMPKDAGAGSTPVQNSNGLP